LERARKRGTGKADARLLPPLVVYEKVWADAGEFGVGFVPHLSFQDLGFIDERSMVAKDTFIDREWEGTRGRHVC